MTKRVLLIGLIFLFIISLSTPAYCDDAIRKLGRGFCNVLTCPLEFAKQAKKTNEEDGPMAAVTYGFLKGIGMMGLRALVGVYEVISFPVPVPKDYKPILTDPEFFFEDENFIW